MFSLCAVAACVLTVVARVVKDEVSGVYRDSKPGCAVLGVIGIITFDGDVAFQRRTAIRRTYLTFPNVLNPRDFEGSTNCSDTADKFVFGFVVAGLRASGNTVNPALLSEQKKHGDMFIMFAREEKAGSFCGCPKCFHFFQFAYKHYNTRYISRIDDDMYIRPQPLALYLQQLPYNPLNNTVVGRCVYSQSRLRCPRTPVAIQRQNYVFVAGAYTFMSPDVVGKLQSCGLAHYQSLRKNKMADDVQLGYLVTECKQPVKWYCDFHHFMTFGGEESTLFTDETIANHSNVTFCRDHKTTRIIADMAGALAVHAPGMKRAPDIYKFHELWKLRDSNISQFAVSLATTPWVPFTRSGGVSGYVVDGIGAINGSDVPGSIASTFLMKPNEIIRVICNNPATRLGREHQCQILEKMR